jgi:peptidyl-prolyl cis-trans isomerase D
VLAASAGAERRVAHILVTIGGDRDETAARTRIAEVQQKLQAGGDFAALAAEYSDDALSGARGGDLGFISRGVMEQALDEAVYALKPGETSTAVRSADGLHLLRVTELAKVEVPDLASQRDRLREQLRRVRGIEVYHDKVDALDVALDENDDFDAVADELSLVVRTSASFGREGGAGVLRNPKFLRELVSDDVLLDRRNSPVVEVGEGHALAFTLREHRMPERRPLAEVSAQIRDVLAREKADKLAEAKAEEIRAAVAAGASLESVAPQGGFPQSVNGANRRQGGVPPEVLGAAFRLPVPAEGKAAVGVAPLYTGGKVVVTVSRVVDGNLLGKSEEQVLARRLELAMSEGRLQLAEFIEDRTGRADVERFEANLKSTGQPPPAPVAP